MDGERDASVSSTSDWMEAVRRTAGTENALCECMHVPAEHHTVLAFCLELRCKCRKLRLPDYLYPYIEASYWNYIEQTAANAVLAAFLD